MQRTRGTGVLVLGIVLGVVGAIMAWAITADAEGFDVNTAGMILFWVGVVTAVIGLALVLAGTRSTTIHRDESLGSGRRYEYEEEHRAI